MGTVMTSADVTFERIYLILAILAAVSFIASVVMGNGSDRLDKVKLMPLGWFFLATIQVIFLARHMNGN